MWDYNVRHVVSLKHCVICFFVVRLLIFNMYSIIFLKVNKRILFVCMETFRSVSGLFVVLIKEFTSQHIRPT